MSHLSVNTIAPVSTTEVELQGTNPPTYLGSELAQKSATVLKAGSTMTGALTLYGDAASNLVAVPKQQLDAAMVNFLTKSLAMPGYQKFPGGLMLQWVTASVGDVASGVPGNTGSVVWPTTFATGCLSVFTTIHVVAGEFSNVVCAITAKSTTGADYQVQEWSAGSNAHVVHFLAIGY